MSSVSLISLSRSEAKIMEDHILTAKSPMVINVKELAAMLSVSHNTAYALIRSGKIRSIRIGRTYRIPRDAVDEYLRKM